MCIFPVCRFSCTFSLLSYVLLLIPLVRFLHRSPSPLFLSFFRLVSGIVREPFHIAPEKCVIKKNYYPHCIIENHVEFDNFQLSLTLVILNSISYSLSVSLVLHRLNFIRSHLFFVGLAISSENRQLTFVWLHIWYGVCYLIFADAYFSYKSIGKNRRKNSPSPRPIPMQQQCLCVCVYIELEQCETIPVNFGNTKTKHHHRIKHISALDGFMLLMILLLASKSNLLFGILSIWMWLASADEYRGGTLNLTPLMSCLV